MGQIYSDVSRSKWVRIQPTLTHLSPSMRAALADLSLDALYAVYPGNRRYRLADRVEAVTLSELVRKFGDSPMRANEAATIAGAGVVLDRKPPHKRGPRRRQVSGDGSATRRSVTNICAAECVIISGIRLCIATTCGVTPQAQNTGSVSGANGV